MASHHRLAIQAKHGVSTWRYAWDLHKVYAEAIAIARAGLQRRGID